MTFKNEFAETIFKNKYANHPEQSWEEKASLIVESVTENLMPRDLKSALAR